MKLEMELVPCILNKGKQTSLRSSPHEEISVDYSPKYAISDSHFNDSPGALGILS